MKFIIYNNIYNNKFIYKNMDQLRPNCIFSSSPYCACVYDTECAELTHEQIWDLVEVPLVRSSQQHQHTGQSVIFDK